MRDRENRDHRYGWLSGFILVVLGVGFLLKNYGITFPIPENWWALFIALAAAFNFVKAWKIYRAEGQVNAKVSGLITGGVSASIVAAVFLFRMDWEKIWPAWLILAGISTMLYRKRRERSA